MVDNTVARLIGQIVRNRRQEYGLTQRQLARHAHVSERFVVSLELGEATGMRLDKLLQVLNALDLTLSINSIGEKSQSIAPDKTDGHERLARYNEAFEFAFESIELPHALLDKLDEQDGCS